MKTETINHEAMAQSHSSIASCCAELAVRAARHTDGRGNRVHPTAIAQLEFLRDDASTMVCSIYEP
ncbi:MAG: AraC family transcriptional regulator CmrA, partial [Cyanobacteria bacterium J06635_15]